MDTGIPAGWVSEAELQAATGISHRNILNWRHHGLLPAPIIRRLGVGVGTETLYPPVTVAMVRRIDELRRRSKDMDEWLWQLWLDGYEIDIVGWCRRRLKALGAVIAGGDAKDLKREVTRSPAKRLDPRRIIYRRLMTRGWAGLMTWAVAVAIGERSAASLFDSAASPLAMLAGRKDVSAAAVVNNMGIDALLAVLDGVEGADLLRVREDCRIIAQPGNAWNLARLILSAMWKSMDIRAGLLPALIALRRSPDHQGSLVDVLGADPTP